MNGHVIANCTQPAVELPYAPPAQTCNGTYVCLPRVYLETMVRGGQVRCLLDTGSEAVLAPYEMVSKYKCKLRATQTRNINAANGSTIFIEGEATIPLQVEGKCLDTVALISKDIKEVILGLQFLEQHDGNWDFAKKRIKFGQGNWIDLVSRYQGTCSRIYAIYARL